jgi:hypothetical protein
LKGVPPGSYSAFGFEAIEPGLYYDLQFNERISDLGVKVTIVGNKTSAPPDYNCLLRVPREKSAGVAR